ncbi:hypothetical protein DBV15_03323 [Temnothorax longispinosus]|uniref:Uncharacterized protein n=1 Tax=Temnothorax longispinosus TaxID=300112 RepID=A0A4S2JTF9_9HYME|nr:hypothetical protein DBV15_03323 [Temnothorax longispinosus]
MPHYDLKICEKPYNVGRLREICFVFLFSNKTVAYRCSAISKLSVIHDTQADLSKRSIRDGMDNEE